MHDHKVTLTPFEMAWGEQLGKWRRANHHKKKLKDRRGLKLGGEDEALALDVGAAQAEMAVAKALNIYFQPRSGTYKNVADIGGSIEVKWAREEVRHNPVTQGKTVSKLLISKSDVDDHTVVFVTGTPPDFIVHGWIKVKRGREIGDRYDKNGRDVCWFVNKAQLNEIMVKPDYGVPEDLGCPDPQCLKHYYEVGK